MFALGAGLGRSGARVGLLEVRHHWRDAKSTELRFLEPGFPELDAACGEPRWVGGDALEECMMGGRSAGNGRRASWHASITEGRMPT